MKESIKRMANLVQRKRKSAAKDETILAACPGCGKQKPTFKMHKSQVDGKHYCTQRCLDERNRGQKELKRMQEIAGL